MRRSASTIAAAAVADVLRDGRREATIEDENSANALWLWVFPVTVTMKSTRSSTRHRMNGWVTYEQPTWNELQGPQLETPPTT